MFSKIDSVCQDLYFPAMSFFFYKSCKTFDHFTYVRSETPSVKINIVNYFSHVLRQFNKTSTCPLSKVSSLNNMHDCTEHCYCSLLSDRHAVVGSGLL